MDENTINAIADKLGIAVDNVGEFIQTYLPSYAGTHIVGDVFWTALMSFLVIVSLVFMLIAINKHEYWNTKYYKMDYDCGSIERRNASRKDDFWATAKIIGVWAFLIILVVALLVMCYCIPDLINWSLYPEASLIREIL